MKSDTQEHDYYCVLTHVTVMNGKMRRYNTERVIFKFSQRKKINKMFKERYRHAVDLIFVEVPCEKIKEL